MIYTPPLLFLLFFLLVSFPLFLPLLLNTSLLFRYTFFIIIFPSWILFFTSYDTFFGPTFLLLLIHPSLLFSSLLSSFLDRLNLDTLLLFFSSSFSCINEQQPCREDRTHV